MFKAVASRTFKIQENYRETEHSIWRMELSFAAQLDQCKDYLPPRETQVFDLLLDGLRLKEIAT